jgi:hypothetical protein
MSASLRQWPGPGRHLLQFDGQQEQRPVQGAVDDEGHHVGGGELGRAEQAQRQHGHPHATFPGYESYEQQHASDHRGQRGWSGPAADGAVNQPVGHPIRPRVTRIPPVMSTLLAAALALAGWLVARVQATTGQLPVHLADTNVARAR